MPSQSEDVQKLIVYGRQPVFEALRSAHEIESVYLASETAPLDKERIQKLAGQRQIKIEFIPKAKMQSICGAVLHQGFAAVLPKFAYLSSKGLLEMVKNKPDAFLLILDQVQDPHNLGAVIRTAENAGVDALVIPAKGAASVTSTVAKTSAGAVFHLPVCRTEALVDLLNGLTENGIILIAAVASGGQILYDADLSGPLGIVIGSEGLGVRKNILNLCKTRITIPQFGRVNSLNASVSGAIIIYETVRQRKGK